MFRDVLFGVEGDEDDAVRINVAPQCENRGFRKSVDCGVVSYKLTKRALSSFYVKLRVLPCRVRCIPYQFNARTNRPLLCMKHFISFSTYLESMRT